MFRMAFYWRQLEAKGRLMRDAAFIAVLDSKPHRETGQYNEAADCVVYDVPIQLIEQQLPKIEQTLIGLKHCRQTNRWPGYQDQPLFVPNWAMEPDAEVDWSTVE